RLFLRNSHWGRARALDSLGRHREADADWERTLQLSPRPQWPGIRRWRAQSRAHAGDDRRAASEVEQLSQARSLPGATLYALACIQALNAASASRDASRPLAERDKRADGYARAALGLLQRAASGGYFRQPANRAQLEHDGILTFLRDRADY